MVGPAGIELFDSSLEVFFLFFFYIKQVYQFNRVYFRDLKLVLKSRGSLNNNDMNCNGKASL